MSLFLYRTGRFVARHRWRVVVAWIALAAAVFAAAGAWGAELNQSPSIPGSDTQRAFDLLDERFPARSGEEARIVVAAPEGETLSADRHAATLRATADAARALPHVVRVDTFTEPGPGQLQLSPDQRIGFLTVQYDGDHNEVGTEAVDQLHAIAEPARQAGLTVALGGDIVEFNQESLDGTAELIGLGVAVVVLLVAFGSVVAMGLPIVTALVALGTGLTLVGIVARFADIPEFGPTLASMIGLGVGIDYALFVVTRHREHLHAGMTVHESVARANATAGQAVVFAGATVVIAILGLQVVGLPFVSGLGQASAVVVAVTVAASVTLLPALLAIVGRGIDRLRIPTRRPADPDHTIAGRWAGRVARRPWPWLVASFLLLAVLAVPVFSIRLGQNDAGTLPPSSTARQAYDLLAEGFGPGFNGPLVVAVDLTQGDLGDAGAVQGAVASDPGVARVLPAVANRAQDPDAALMVAFLTTSPQDEATERTIARLRHDVIPPVVAGTGTPAYVAGSTTAWIDIGDKIEQRLPWFVGSVLLLSFVLLMVVFRSLLVPLKAAVMNLLGIGASYGVIVAIFQWGWAKDLVGLEETVPIIHFLPMFMFAILFGLSMDYEVFLMSRIREEYLANGGDNLASVRTGIATTARVITAAAIIMVSVFGSFALLDDVAVKMSGIGLATAIFLDATVIRLVLVPATMAVAGRANWWLPGWLDRVLPRLDIEGESALPEPEYRWDRHPSVNPPFGDADDLAESDERELVGAKR
jgi:RND superfamily putative drug exporter